MIGLLPIALAWLSERLKRAIGVPMALLLPGGLRSIMEAILLDTMFEVMISRQVVEGTAGPLYMYAARAGGAKAT